MSDFNFDWQPMDFPTAPSPRTAGQRSQPIFSAQHMQMQPVAPRVRVSNSQLAGSNTAWMNRTPAQNRGLGANTAFAPPFETAANVSISTRTYEPTTVSAHMMPSITNARNQ
jgi:hypothetical protein